MAIVCSGARPIGYLGTSLSISQDYVAGFANTLGVICESKVGGASPERASAAIEQTLEGKADTGCWRREPNTDNDDPATT